MPEKRNWNEVQKVMERAVSKGETVGCNILVYKNGKELYFASAGMADRENNKELDRNAIFRLYSMSKPVTAVAVMILVERGIIDLMDAVSMYLPGFKNQKVLENGRLMSVKREVEIKDLLNMTSGLVYADYAIGQPGYETEKMFDDIMERLDTENELTTVEVGNKIGQYALAFQPGDSWKYGTSADVLGAVVEVASGMKFGDFLEQEIFQPLGMKDTGFWVKPENLHRLARSYICDPEKGCELYEGDNLGIRNAMDRRPRFESGGAGLVSTLDDYVRFGQMLLGKGEYQGKRILSEKAVQYLISDSLNKKQKEAFANWHGLEGHSYGNLMRIMTDSRKAMILGTNGEYGWDGWLGGYFVNSPAEQVTLVLMMQRTDSGIISLTRKLKNVIWSLI